MERGLAGAGVGDGPREPAGANFAGGGRAHGSNDFEHPDEVGASERREPFEGRSVALGLPPRSRSVITFEVERDDP